MGRMLDAFRQRQLPPQMHETGTPHLRTVWPEENQRVEEEAGSDAEQEMPFIEVGGEEILTNEHHEPPRDDSHSPGGPSSWMTVRFRPVPTLSSAGQRRSHVVPELIVFHDPEHPASQQYRELAKSLLLHLPDEQSRVLLFSPTRREVGATTVLLNSALTLAQHQDKRVLVIDACLKHQAIAQRLGLPEAPGLVEALEQRVPVQEAIQSSGVANLYVMTGGNVEARSSMRLAGDRMRTLLHAVQSHVDLILIDGPVWDGRPAVVALGCQCDAVYVCAPEKEQDHEDVTEMLDVMVEQGAPLQGCILTSR